MKTKELKSTYVIIIVIILVAIKYWIKTINDF